MDVENKWQQLNTSHIHTTNMSTQRTQIPPKGKNETLVFCDDLITLCSRQLVIKKIKSVMYSSFHIYSYAVLLKMIS